MESCIAACQTWVDACKTCSTENKGNAEMENSLKLCIFKNDTAYRNDS